MSQTEQAVSLQAEAINKLTDIIKSVLQSKQVTESDLANAKQQAADLIAKDESNASLVSDATTKLQQLIDLAAAAVPAPATAPAS